MLFRSGESYAPAISTLKRSLGLNENATPDDVVYWLKDRYDLEAHGSEDNPIPYTDEEFRKIAGVRYEMERTNFNYNNPYTFATNIKIETVPKIKERSFDMDAEDAAQDILLKMITHLSSFRGDSAFTTWVFRIAVNHLKNYKKHMFARFPLSFEYYGDDIENGKLQDVPDLTQNVEKELLAEELKMSCTNVMLQCLDPESRCIFILGTMFQLDSRIAGEILEMTPEAYRQRLSRARRKMADFLGQYCGEYGGGRCKCKDRVNYAIQNQIGRAHV